MNRLVLVVDFGTSNVHVNAVDCENGDIPFSTSRKYKMICPKTGYVELDCEEMWKCSEECVSSIVNQINHQKDIYRIEAFSFSFFGDNVIPVDKDGNAVYHMLQCFDVRGKEQAVKLNEELGEDTLIQVTGDICENTSCSSKIRYIREEMPEIAGRTVRYYNIQQYILRKLNLPDVNDLTMACTKRMIDLEHSCWYRPLLEAVGITEEQLGEIVLSTKVIGTVDRYGSVILPNTVKVVPGAHDCDCGWLGVGVSDEKQDVVGNITGTFEHFGFLADGYRNLYAEHPDWGIYSYRGPLQDISVMLTAFDTSGALLEWFMREINGSTEKEAYDRYWKETVFDGKGTVRVRPDFGQNMGSIEGLHLGHTKKDIFQAVIEALTFESRRMLELCEKTKKGGINRVRIGGGGAKSPEWVQFRADVTGKTYEVMEQNEVSSVGAAILAAAGAGIYPDIETAILHMVRIKNVYHPDKKVHELYQEAYQNYIETYRR